MIQFKLDWTSFPLFSMHSTKPKTSSNRANIRQKCLNRPEAITQNWHAINGPLKCPPLVLASSHVFIIVYALPIATVLLLLQCADIKQIFLETDSSFTYTNNTSLINIVKCHYKIAFLTGFIAKSETREKKVNVERIDNPI